VDIAVQTMDKRSKSKHKTVSYKLFQLDKLNYKDFFIVLSHIYMALSASLYCRIRLYYVLK